LSAGHIPDGKSVVCTLTGHGLKDPDVAISQCPAPVRVAPTVDAVRAAILR
jgi:threonine synthase